jgi:hypothetical protein
METLLPVRLESRLALAPELFPLHRLIYNRINYRGRYLLAPLRMLARHLILSAMRHRKTFLDRVKKERQLNKLNTKPGTVKSSVVISYHAVDL